MEADYTLENPLWDLGDGPGDVDVDHLALGPSLYAELEDWSTHYLSPLLDRGSHIWPGDDWFAAWVERGRHLAQRVQRELGPEYQVLYFNESTREYEPVDDESTL